jgi:hypothetical protein
MAAARAGFSSPATDVRRAVVQLLVALALALRDPARGFARYAAQWLTPPQAQLLAIYVEKAKEQAA